MLLIGLGTGGQCKQLCEGAVNKRTDPGEVGSRRPDRPLGCENDSTTRQDKTILLVKKVFIEEYDALSRH